MPIQKSELVKLARGGLIFDVVLKDDGSYTVEVKLPISYMPSSKHTITQEDESYELVAFLTDLKEPNVVFRMWELANDKSSRLYRIPKKLYNETILQKITEKLRKIRWRRRFRY